MRNPRHLLVIPKVIQAGHWADSTVDSLIIKAHLSQVIRALLDSVNRLSESYENFMFVCLQKDAKQCFDATHSKKKSTSEHLFWCFSLSQIEDSIQYLEGP